MKRHSSSLEDECLLFKDTRGATSIRQDRPKEKSAGDGGWKPGVPASLFAGTVFLR
jgi:hypothetical protein